VFLLTVVVTALIWSAIKVLDLVRWLVARVLCSSGLRELQSGR
jgi:hypothetical protein